MDSDVILLIVVALGFWWYYNNNILAPNPVPGVGNYSGSALIGPSGAVAKEAALTQSVFKTSTGNTGAPAPPPKNPLYENYIIPNTNLSKKVAPYWAKPQPGTVSLKAPVK